MFKYLRCTLAKLLIADDHSYLVQGVMVALKDSDITVLEHVMDASLIVDAYIRLKPDVLLCDIMFGQSLNGLDVVSLLLKVDPTSKVILFSQFDQDETIYSAYNLGAKAFLPKSIHPNELIDAIHRVNQGELYFTADIAVKMAKKNFDKRESDKPLEEILTSKELEIMKLVSDGDTDQEAATKLGVSKKTVSNLKASIKDKLNIERNSSMTKIALKYGLIKYDEDK